MAEPDSFDGVPVTALARRCGVPAMIARSSVTSTMDLAHAEAAAGAADGTVIVADAQSAGRGRSGGAWLSAPGRGLWLTVIARDADRTALGALPLRVGLAAAIAIEEVVPAVRVLLKWPNDLFVEQGKVGGVLTEARWRGEVLDWVAIGIGINVGDPEFPGGAGLPRGVRRPELLCALVPGVRAAVAARGILSAEELAAFADRDLARGKACALPREGVVSGVAPDGALLIESEGVVHEVRSGSLMFPEPAVTDS